MTPKHLTLDNVHALGIFCAWTVEIWRRGFRESAQRPRGAGRSRRQFVIVCVCVCFGLFVLQKKGLIEP